MNNGLKSDDNNDHKELIKYFDSLNYDRQKYILIFLKDFCKVVNEKSD